MIKLINFQNSLNASLYDELNRKVYYISDEIRNYEIIFDTEKKYIIGIKVDLDDTCDYQLLEKKVLGFIEYDVRFRRHIPSKIIWESKEKDNFRLKSFDDLLNNQIVINMGEGQMALNSLLINVMDFFDNEICKIVSKEFNAKEYRYPTLIKTETIKKCGYLDTFPHFLMIVTRLHNDFQNYKAFSQSEKCTCGCEDIEKNILQYCKNGEYCLPPTMCYYTYQQYSGKTINNNFTVTSKGKSFRYEGKYCKTLERLWDFTIRELVFLGEYEYVLNCRKTIMNATFNLVDELKLVGHCETASDPFFFDESANDREIFQKYLQSKYELRLNIEKNKTIAIGSFNFHDKFFSTNFDIRFNDNNLIKTGCTGFGLERLAYAFICQYGLDTQIWPEKVKAYINITDKL